tara:strand:+ start:205 stop:642 length:438 start_codon:yes stop_codon:yes gene_type:complete
VIETRLLAYALIAGAGLLVVTTVLHWRSEAQRLPAVEMRLAATLAAQETARRIRAEVTQNYAQELDRLRNKPARVIRVCDAPGVPATGAAPGGTDAPGAPGGELQAETGRDIGPALYAEAARADTLAAQLRALQSWVSSSISTSK